MKQYQINEAKNIYIRAYMGGCAIHFIHVNECRKTVNIGDGGCERPGGPYGMERLAMCVCVCVFEYIA